MPFKFCRLKSSTVNFVPTPYSHSLLLSVISSQVKSSQVNHDTVIKTSVSCMSLINWNCGIDRTGATCISLRKLGWHSFIPYKYSTIWLQLSLVTQSRVLKIEQSSAGKTSRTYTSTPWTSDALQYPVMNDESILGMLGCLHLHLGPLNIKSYKFSSEHARRYGFYSFNR